MSHPVRGKAIIINNVHFKYKAKLRRREGSRVDANSLEECLRHLKFDVKKYESETKENILKILETAAKDDHTNEDCIVVSLMSHGGAEGICAADFDKRDFTGLLTLSDIVDPFKGDKCPTLAGKPKIFILNACRGDDMDYGVEERDGGDVVDSCNALQLIPNRLPIDADIFICFSCSEGYSTLRDEISGSYFIQELSRVLTEFSRGLHLSELILKVKEMVSARQTVVRGSLQKEMQMPVVVDTLRKLVYFDMDPNQTERRQPSE